MKNSSKENKMNRSDFLKKSAFMGMGLAFLPTLLSCSKDDSITPSNSSQKVLIIGAGAAGLTAGYLLKRQGIDFQIIEATSVFGGRVKKTQDFADFPIDLGAEWIHVDNNPRSLLEDMVDNDNLTIDTEFVAYSPTDAYSWENGTLVSQDWSDYLEYKFKNTTWYDFFEEFIVPSISNYIVYNSPVQNINYSNDTVLISVSNGEVFEADKVLITVPMPILQSNSITFEPTLPQAKLNAFNNIPTPPGIKVFIEFSEKFYPDAIEVSTISGEKLYYDAAFGKDVNSNVLALFYVDDGANELTDLPNNTAILNAVLTELDDIFNGQASQYYVNHVIQNWSNEPYIQGSYSHNESESVRLAALEPVNNKLFFAGEAYSEGFSSTVDGAAFSAYEAVDVILAS